ncbi:type IV pilus modification PilV family protein [Hyalangium versicolor]|uniref:type IV pilus modification PilV family protein n=1 Tax=Hyalangium versicolor TaxID=2861190 RepID=UPI001CCD40CB|nr:hypothetical protein [Hyalangium versicolor]
MHLSSSRLSPRGTSLIEAMAALVVFSVGILGVMQMNVLASRQNNLAQTQTTATRIARDVADSFERLPFTDPVFTVRTTMQQDNPNFTNMDIADGLVTLEEAQTMPGTRPILGASGAIFSYEGENNFYRVAWRTQVFPNAVAPEELRILVMVRFPTPGGGMKQVNTWSIKADPRIFTANSKTTAEP